LVATERIIHFVHHFPSAATEVKHKRPHSRISVSHEYQRNSHWLFPRLSENVPIALTFRRLAT
jgi:hypothetical protein